MHIWRAPPSYIMTHYSWTICTHWAIPPPYITHDAQTMHCWTVPLSYIITHDVWTMHIWTIVFTHQMNPGLKVKKMHKKMLKDWWKYRNYLCATFYKHPNPPGKVICTLVWIINTPNLERKKWNLPIHVQAINSTGPSADVVLTPLTSFLHISLVCTCTVFHKKDRHVGI